MIEDIAEVWDEFKKDIMPKVREAVREHTASYPEDFARPARVRYLKGRMEDVVFRTLCLMEDHDRHTRTDDIDNRLFTGEQILGGIKTIQALQREIISLRRPEKQGEMTEDMIRQAKARPFTELHEFRRNQAVCPFHADKDPSMHLFPDNHVYCFSCAKGWDTIGFLMDRDGLSFPEAVKRLQ